MADTRRAGKQRIDLAWPICVKTGKSQNMITPGVRYQYLKDIEDEDNRHKVICRMPAGCVMDGVDYSGWTFMLPADAVRFPEDLIEGGGVAPFWQTGELLRSFFNRSGGEERIHLSMTGNWMCSFQSPGEPDENGYRHNEYKHVSFADLAKIMRSWDENHVPGQDVSKEDIEKTPEIREKAVFGPGDNKVTATWVADSRSLSRKPLMGWTYNDFSEKGYNHREAEDLVNVARLCKESGILSAENSDSVIKSFMNMNNTPEMVNETLNAVLSGMSLETGKRVLSSHVFELPALRELRFAAEDGLDARQIDDLVERGLIAGKERDGDVAQVLRDNREALSTEYLEVLEMCDTGDLPAAEKLFEDYKSSDMDKSQQGGLRYAINKGLGADYLELLANPTCDFNGKQMKALADAVSAGVRGERLMMLADPDLSPRQMVFGWSELVNRYGFENRLTDDQVKDCLDSSFDAVRMIALSNAYRNGVDNKEYISNIKNSEFDADQAFELASAYSNNARELRNFEEGSLAGEDGKPNFTQERLSWLAQPGMSASKMHQFVAAWEDGIPLQVSAGSCCRVEEWSAKGLNELRVGLKQGIEDIGKILEPGMSVTEMRKIRRECARQKAEISGRSIIEDAGERCNREPSLRDGSLRERSDPAIER